jgi:hypothetical protein
VLPCGVGEELAADRYREQNGLLRNPAVRFFGPDSASSEASSTLEAEEEGFTSSFMNGIRTFFREIAEAPEEIQFPSIF